MKRIFKCHLCKEVFFSTNPHHSDNYCFICGISPVIFYDVTDKYEYCEICETFFDVRLEDECECLTECPEGGDISNDCADCEYSAEYHFVDGECVLR